METMGNESEVQSENTSKKVQNPTKMSGNNNYCLSSKKSIPQRDDVCKVRNLKKNVKFRQLRMDKG